VKQEKRDANSFASRLFHATSSASGRTRRSAVASPKPQGWVSTKTSGTNWNGAAGPQGAGQEARNNVVHRQSRDSLCERLDKTTRCRLTKEPHEWGEQSSSSLSSRRALGKPRVWLHSALTPRALQAAGQVAPLPPHLQPQIQNQSGSLARCLQKNAENKKGHSYGGLSTCFWRNYCFKNSAESFNSSFKFTPTPRLMMFCAISLASAKECICAVPH